MKAIIGAQILMRNEILKNHVLVFDESIHAIETEEAYKIRCMNDGNATEEFHLNGLLVPGFIDIHIHGSNGHDVMDGSVHALEEISKSLIKSGTTSFLATTMTMSQPEIEKSLDTIQSYIKLQEERIFSKSNFGARLIGAHLEGPFINPAYKGAQNEKHVQRPTREWLEPYMDIVKMITLAPEMDEGFNFTRSFKDTGIVLSIGHSGCDYETASVAYDEGINHITHCFNAMTGLHHRKPGIVGAALTMPFTLDLIPDGIHIHPDFMGPFIKLKGIDQTILITDAMRAAMMPEGNFDLGGQPVIVKDGCCRLEDGTLAGSILSTDQALRNLLDKSDLCIDEIVRMLSENPAKRLGLFSERGSLEIGKKADIVVLDDVTQVSHVFINGELNYYGGMNEYNHCQKL